MRTRRLLSVSAAALLAVTALAACGDDGSSDASATSRPPVPAGENIQECTKSAAAPTASAEVGAKPGIEIPDGAPPCELQVKDLKKGSGEAVKDVEKPYRWNYEGVAWSTGEVFDSSFDRGAPAPFALGQVIGGWKQGLKGMQPGGRRMLVIPPGLAYGEGGAPGIAPGETLVFVVDLIGPVASAK